jgi:hypothetical protein
MIITIIVAVGIVVSGLLIYAFFKSPEMNVAQELLINATPDAIFPYINDLKKSFTWLTWLDDDPDAGINYSGSSEGVGAVASWKSTGHMGVGTAEVVKSIPNRSVQMKLIYIKPMAMSQLAEISLTSSNRGTLAHLSMKWNNPYILRLMCIFVSMDKLMSASFVKGLLNLKQLVENASL